jgi:hypothetical protein
LRLKIVGGGVRKRVQRRFSDNDPDFFRECSQDADMTGDELVLDPHPVADLERFARECVGPSLGARTRQREQPFGKFSSSSRDTTPFSVHSVAKPVSERS